MSETLNQADFTEVSQDISKALADGGLSAEEETMLLQEYDTEKCSIHNECAQGLGELKSLLSIVGVGDTLTQEERVRLQMILKTAKNQRTGNITPEELQKYFQKADDIRFTGDIKDLLTAHSRLKEKFNSIKDDSERKKLQGDGKLVPDGEWGQDTFWYMLSQEIGTQTSPPTASHIEVTGKTSEDNVLSPTQEVLPEPVATVETIPTLIIPDKKPGDQHPETLGVSENIDILSEEEKIEKFIQEAKNIHPVLIKFLQEELGVTPDGAFGPKSATSAIEKFPNISSLLEVMEKLGIPKESDALLPGEGGMESRDELRKRYGELFKILENMEGTNFPPGMIESIIRQETKYGGWKLISPTNCIGLMQLTSVAVKDMEMGYRGERYRTYFQNLPLDTVLSLPVGDTGKTIEQSIPRPIIDSLQLLHNPETDDVTYSQNIKKIERFIKADASYFNHPVNIIIGSIYLAGIYNNEGGGEVEKTAKLYNSDTAVMKAYGKAVEGFQAEIFEEGYYNS